MDKQTGAQVVHALAALRDCNGNVAEACAKLDISAEQLLRPLEEVGSNFYEMTGDGRIVPSIVGLRFASQIDIFPYANW